MSAGHDIDVRQCESDADVTIAMTALELAEAGKKRISLGR